MKIIDFAAYRATKSIEVQVVESEFEGGSQEPSLESVTFSGEPEEVIDATLAWLNEQDPYEAIQFGDDGDPAMVIDKGSISFIDFDEHDRTWHETLKAKELAQRLNDGWDIWQAQVLVAIISEHRADLARLLREGIFRDSWRQSPFLGALMDDKDKYYS
jgi:hypothetical protein